MPARGSTATTSTGRSVRFATACASSSTPTARPFAPIATARASSLRRRRSSTRSPSLTHGVRPRRQGGIIVPAARCRFAVRRRFAPRHRALAPRHRALVSRRHARALRRVATAHHVRQRREVVREAGACRGLGDGHRLAEGRRTFRLAVGRDGLGLQLTIWVKFCYNVIRKMKKRIME